MWILTSVTGETDPTNLTSNSGTIIFYSRIQWLSRKTTKQIHRVNKQALYPKSIEFKTNQTNEDKNEVFLFHFTEGDLQ